ncbi:hypothetical protein CCP3SC15_690006 [Gammaproteobacteria bacterium]
MGYRFYLRNDAGKIYIDENSFHNIPSSLKNKLDIAMGLNSFIPKRNTVLIAI